MNELYHSNENLNDSFTKQSSQRESGLGKMVVVNGKAVTQVPALFSNCNESNIGTFFVLIRTNHL